MAMAAIRASFALAVSVVPAVATAQHTPAILQTAVTAERRAVLDEHISHWFKTCLEDWDAATHMTRQEWKVTCQRVADERRTFLLENPDALSMGAQKGRQR